MLHHPLLPIILTLISFLPSLLALHLPRPLTLHLNSTLPILFPPTHQNLSAWSLRHCVTDPTWNPLTEQELAPSCETAFEQLVDAQSVFGRSPGLFRYNNGRSYARFPAVGKTLTVPKRYVSGPCVVAIVMMKMFEAGGMEFPELEMGGWPDSDEASWRDLVEPGSYVRATCQNACGYAVLGEGLGVAVVIWGTNSRWDRFIRGMRGGWADGSISGH